MDLGFETLKQSSAVSLPIELIFSCILPKLPAKSLLRFKCVSKSFLTEISSHKFNASFFEANRFFILPGKQLNTFCIYELDSPNSSPTICTYPIWSQKYVPLLAFCESYVFMAYSLTFTFPWPKTLILLNPITRIYRILPKVHIPSSIYSAWYGMCQSLDDEFNDDVKVVRFLEYEGPHENRLREVNIYHLRTNLWRTIECETSADRQMCHPVLVQNHLLVMLFWDYNRRLTRIGCFDVKAERWSNDVLLPDTISGEISSHSSLDSHYYYLGVLDGKLCFSWYDMKKATYTIWIMKNYGDKSSWVILMSLPAQEREKVYHPIAYRKGSSHELLCISRFPGYAKHFWYNLREKQFTETGFDRDSHNNNNNLHFAFTCKGSLSTFPSRQPIRSSSKIPNNKK